MLFQWTKAPLLVLVCGLCLSLQDGANAQNAVETFSVNVPGEVSTRPLAETPSATTLPGPDGQPVVPVPQAAPGESALPSQAEPPLQPQPQPQFQSQPPAEQQAQTQPPLAALPATPVPGRTRVALLLPLRSATLGRAAEAVRAGFFAAYERERQGVEVTLFETGEAPQDVVAGYRNASAAHDIVVGPLTRSGVTALARSGEVLRPTIALTTPDFADGTDVRPPALMLAMGLSIEDEARQAADWASRNHATSVAYVVHTPTAWQRRAARAFAAHWARSGMALKTVELPLSDGFLDAAALQALRIRLGEESSPFLFAALDAGQARQLRESVGRQYPLYGTSQLNPVALPDRADAEPVVEMEGAYLFDIPWQLQADHPAVMAYPRLPVAIDQKRNADLERLYALGIDAYRVARELAAQHTNFELDGVTGRLTVRFDRFGPYFERTVQQAVYNGGSVTAAGIAR